MDRIRQWKRPSAGIILFLFTAFIVQSCTSLKTIYNWADSYLSWKIDHYFDVTDEQETFVDLQLGRILQNYKVQEFPKYHAFLSEIKTRTERQLTTDDLTWFRDTLDLFNTNIAYLLVNDVTLFLGGLNEKQLLHLEKTLKSDNESWFNEHQKEAKKHKNDQLDDLYEKVEDWIGELTKEQKQEIAALYDSQNDSYLIRYNHRLQSQQRFVELLKRGYQKEELRAALLDWYLNADRSYSSEYRELRQKSIAWTNAMILLLDGTASDKQRQFFSRKLDSYLKQLEEIVAG